MITISKEEHEELLRDVKIFELFMNRLISEAIERSVQQTLMRIPDVVVHHVKQQHFLSKAIKEFFINHPELNTESNKRTFGQLVNINSLQKPNLGVKELLEDTANIVKDGMRSGKTIEIILEDINNGKTRI